MLTWSLNATISSLLCLEKLESRRLTSLDYSLRILRVYASSSLESSSISVQSSPSSIIWTQMMFLQAATLSSSAQSVQVSPCPNFHRSQLLAPQLSWSLASLRSRQRLIQSRVEWRISPTVESSSRTCGSDTLHVGGLSSVTSTWRLSPISLWRLWATRVLARVQSLRWFYAFMTPQKAKSSSMAKTWRAFLCLIWETRSRSFNKSHFSLMRPSKRTSCLVSLLERTKRCALSQPRPTPWDS